MRAAAARTANVSGGAALLEGLKRALASEQDGDAADEEMLALAALGGRQVADLVIAAGRRLGDHGLSTAATAVARALGPEALSTLPGLREAGLEGYDAFYLWSTRGGTQGLTAAGSIALRDRGPAAWGAVLEIARRPGASLDPGVVLSALSDPDDAIRTATFWHLALVCALDGKLDDRVAVAAAAALDAERPKDLAAALALELLGRALGRKATERQAWIAALVEQKARAPYATRLAWEKALLAKLDRREIEALSTATPVATRNALGKSIKGRRSASGKEETAPSLRTPDGLPRGFVASVLAATGRDPRVAHGLAMAEIVHGPDGRPRQVQVVGEGPRGPLDQPPACQEAGRVLLASDVVNDVSARQGGGLRGAGGGSADVSGGRSAACGTDQDFAGRRGGRGRTAQRAGCDQGAAEGQARQSGLSPGCERASHRGRRGPRGDTQPDGLRSKPRSPARNPDLNWESIRTVSQWRYTPTLLNGVPVPVIMTTTVNYRLH